MSENFVNLREACAAERPALTANQGGADVTGGGSLDIGSIIGQIASGGVGGGVLMVIVGLIKQAIGGGQKAA